MESNDSSDINKITLECFINKNCKDKYLKNHDKAKYDELVTAYNNQEYARSRRKEYPDRQEQLNYIYDNGIDKWKTDIVDPVKQKYPKP